ncbi:hypothetical protein Zmor_017707 [Zophobas morio]|uniref:Glycosyltransferase family 92 protein n=1 Tax=Zophobas morio TaxID=2755281 RepID=A0AA38MD03_9CUCU|nr:hypothetical protein Zmor_017707 [Zophobas morio]
MRVTTEVISLKHNPPYVASLRNHTGNLPDIYLNDKSKKPKGFNSTCARFPDFFNLHFRNDHWQIQNTTKGILFLFNAYLDKRDNVVRIVAAYDVYRSQTPLHCQLWYNGSTQPVLVKSEVPFWMFYPKWGADNGYFIHPYLITCPVVLLDNASPVSVSLAENPCDSTTNNVKIYNPDYKEKKNFVVCVKGMSFPYDDHSVRLTEWIELLRILGAEKVNFYEFNVHPNTQRVLDYYVAKGFVEVTPVTIAGDSSNHPLLQSWFLRKKIISRRLQEVLPFNDCLYKHLSGYKYVVLLDTDEVIVPANGTWVELIETVQHKYPNSSSYVARNVYFFDEYLHQHDWFDGIPKYMHMLQHVYRAKNYTKPGHFVKGFHDTEKVVALHNHLPFKCHNSCRTKEIDLNLGHLQHYRVDCASGVGNCQSMKANSVLDTRMWNFKDELIGSVQATFKELDLDISDCAYK